MAHDRDERPQGVCVLGSTGSIGTNTLDVIARHPGRFEVLALAGGRRVVQYGDTLMPLHLCDPAMALPENGTRPVIVFKAQGGQEGLTQLQSGGIHPVSLARHDPGAHVAEAVPADGLGLVPP